MDSYYKNFCQFSKINLGLQAIRNIRKSFSKTMSQWQQTQTGWV